MPDTDPSSLFASDTVPQPADSSAADDAPKSARRTKRSTKASKTTEPSSSEVVQPPRRRGRPRKNPVKQTSLTKIISGPDGEKEVFDHKGQLKLDMQFTDAIDARTNSYMPRAFIQASLPYKRPLEADGTPKKTIVRTSPSLTMTITTINEEGLPYGAMPRLILAYITQEAIRNRSRRIDLGDSINDMLRLFQRASNGGRNGTQPQFKKQLNLLLSSMFCFEWRKNISSTPDTETNVKLRQFFPAVEKSVIFETKGKKAAKTNPNDKSLYYLFLNESFYEEIINSPVPVDMRAMCALQKSPLAMDLYTFYTYRVFNLKKPLNLPWTSLMRQFALNVERLPDFRRQFRAATEKVLEIYPELRVDTSGQDCVVLYPSPPHVRQQKAKKPKLSGPADDITDVIGIDPIEAKIEAKEAP